MKRFSICFTAILLFVLSSTANAQVDARMLQYPDVSQTHIVFSFGGDIWIVAKEGGTANKLTSAKGQEYLPRFSPDGSMIAFDANYDGNTDIYVIPSMGGQPFRVTHHPMEDRIAGWYPDGKKILFTSSMNSGRQRYSQFYSVPVKGGLPDQLPVPYGEFGAISPDGSTIAYTPRTTAYRTWKRYRGGMATDIFLFNLKTLASENITDNDANDEFPMWHGGKIYFLSDRGSEKRANIFSYDTKTKETKQITKFTDYDIHFPSIGPSDLVFEAGGKLYLLDLSTEKYAEVKINVFTDESTLMPKVENVSKLIQGGSISPDGKRVSIAARGDLFSLPAENGPVYNLTNSSGVAERFPSWSPNGKLIAYWSDKSGEYELYIKDMENPKADKKLTSYGPGFRYNIFWSPDNKKLAFIDKTMTIYIYDFEKDKTVKVDKEKYMSHGPLMGFTASWSPDSRWLAYGKELDNRHTAIALFDTKEEKVNQVTSGYYNDSDPAFDPDGKYLYFFTGRNFNPSYSDLDNSFIYANSTNIAAVTLTADIASPLAPKNDTTAIKKDEEKKAEKKDEKKPADEKEKMKETKITLEGFEDRAVILPPQAGNYNSLTAVSGKVIYQRRPNTGADEKKSPVVYYDLDKREEKTIAADADAFMISADGKKIAAFKSGSLAVGDVAPDQKFDKKVPLEKMEMTVDPRAEWKQIFMDVWRLERDYFYDPNMHGVDWNEMRTRYGILVDNAVSREDVNYIIGELIAELNASHTYRGGGDVEQPDRRNTGLLGVDWELSNGYYKIKTIIKGAPWDSEVRSALDMPGLNAKEGDYVLAVNGVAMNTNEDPWAAFDGLAGQTVELTVNDKPSFDGSRKILVEAMRDETRLRNLAWIEANRKRVDEASSGKLGYIYVPSTGIDGQTELERQFNAQFTKEGLIIDERFNSGGQIPDRFIELLNRKALAFWAVRDGKNWQWPPVANFGPKAMLINGWSGSGGDAFPDYFRKAKLGPLVGMRTWGGLIGISGAPALIDGGSVTVPTFRMYDPDGKWFLEGHGVDPDIKVPEDPTQLAKGVDTQLDKAIQAVMDALKTNPPVNPKQPAYEKR